MTVIGTRMQNQINVDPFWPPARFDNVMHVPLANYPHQYFQFYDITWDGNDPLPRAGLPAYLPQRGSRMVVTNWQGTGKDYLLLFNESLGSKPSWHSGPGVHLFNTPVAGLTMEQSWNRYGMSFAGDMVRDSEAVHLDGLVNGVAREGLDVPLGPPRAVVTYPTMRAAAVVEPGGWVRIYALLTGSREAASPIMMFSVDGERPQAVDLAAEKNGTDDRTFGTTRIAPGVHTVKVWRTQKNDTSKPVPGSEYTSQYCIGPCPEIPHGHMALSAQNLTIESGGGPASQSFTLSNSGATASYWTAKTNQEWCLLSGYNGLLPVGKSASFKVTAARAPKAGSSVCTVTFTDANADNSPQTMTVNAAFPQ
jgi:hypothetical protein